MSFEAFFYNNFEEFTQLAKILTNSYVKSKKKIDARAVGRLFYYGSNQIHQEDKEKIDYLDTEADTKLTNTDFNSDSETEPNTYT